MDKAAEKKARDKAKRLEAKFAKVQGGLEELEIWLCDLIRGGLLALPEKPRQFWESAAVRMVDAQTSGMAAAIRQLRDLDYRNDQQWQEDALAIIARMWMTVKGFGQREHLPEAMQADMRAQLGIGPGPKDVLADPEAESISDQWLAIGCHTELIDDITTQRNWLYGCNSGRFALVIYFALKKMPIESTITPGRVHEGELVFFPSATPLRAVIRQQTTVSPNIPDISPALPDWASAEKMIAERLAANPWSDHFPLFVDGVQPFIKENGFGICDYEKTIIPLAEKDAAQQVRTLLALSGGRAAPVFLLYRQQQIYLLGIPHNGAFFLTK